MKNKQSGFAVLIVCLWLVAAGGGLVAYESGYFKLPKVTAPAVHPSAKHDYNQ